jgi:hypothetical protein
MRTVQETLFQEAPPELDVPALGAELVQNMGLPLEQVNKWIQHLTSAGLTTARAVMQQTLQEHEEATGAADFDASSVRSLCICLGSATAPYIFTPKPVPQGQPETLRALTEVKATVKAEGKEGKGGALKEAADVLEVRREQMDVYCPPASFDKYAKGSMLRNEDLLRKSIVTEVSFAKLQPRRSSKPMCS